MISIPPFRHVVVADFEFEFGGHAGNRPRPICMVAKDLCTGQEWRLWRDQFGAAPPFPTGDDTLFVAYYASAELGCFKALGWSMPKYVLDLYAEFRNRTNGIPTPAGNGLVGACTYFGLDTIDADEKNEMRDLALRGPPWTDTERADLLEYCAGDTVALERLLPAMLPRINLKHALLRGRYMRANAIKEWNGVPIDTASLAPLCEHWDGIQDELIAEIDRDYGVFDGRTFKRDAWRGFLARHGIPWPQDENGALNLDKDTFRQMAKTYPIVSSMRELRSALSDLRLNDLAVGEDGRARTVLWAFASRTGRNQPSSSKYIFGPSVWLRSLIKPPVGYGIAYCDWSQQEFGIAAALSGDRAMMMAYLSGDPYLEFAKQAGAVPVDATKQTHGAIRELYKQCALAVLYGMSAYGLAAKLGVPIIIARGLIEAHKRTFRQFWKWSEAVINHAYATRRLETAFGWRIHLGDDVNPRSLMNFPMQANGAEMMRLAACLATEREIGVCASVHDAFLICAPLDRLEAEIEGMRSAMFEASRIVLDNALELRADVKRIVYPDRYSDDRGAVMWARVMGLIAKRQGKAAAA